MTQAEAIEMMHSGQNVFLQALQMDRDIYEFDKALKLGRS
jgi:hypothetical protein